MLTTRHKAALNRFFEHPARWMVRLGLGPSTVTVGGLALVGASCLFLLVTRRIFSFCVLVTLASLLDALDGAVARVSGRVTKFGAYLDAVCDRVGEAIIIIAVASVTGDWLLSAIVLAGAMLVSYTKARAAMEVPIANLEWPDLMERTERGTIYLVGLALSSFIPWRPFGRDLFWWTLVVLAVLVSATVLQRILRARRLIEARSTPTSLTR